MGQIESLSNLVTWKLDLLQLDHVSCPPLCLMEGYMMLSLEVHLLLSTPLWESYWLSWLMPKLCPVEITFHKQLPEAFQMIEYGVFHTALKIDEDRNCTLVDNI